MVNCEWSMVNRQLTIDDWLIRIYDLRLTIYNSQFTTNIGQLAIYDCQLPFCVYGNKLLPICLRERPGVGQFLMVNG